jgi:hypothetical protein
MKKLAIALLILVATLTAETVGELYTNNLTSVVLTNDSIEYLAFDLPNAQVLQARLIKFDSMFKPWTNNQYDYMFNLLCTNQATILGLEQDYIEEKKKIKTIGFVAVIGTLAGLIIGGLLF